MRLCPNGQVAGSADSLWVTVTHHGAPDPASAIEEFALDEHVVPGTTLEESTDPDHPNVQAIVSADETAGATFFGSVDLGVSTSNCSDSQLRNKIDARVAAGIDGIFLSWTAPFWRFRFPQVVWCEAF